MEIPSGTVRRQLSYNLLILNANNINTRITLSWTKISFSTKRKYLIETMSVRLSQHTQTWLQSGLSGERNEQPDKDRDLRIGIPIRNFRIRTPNFNSMVHVLVVLDLESPRFEFDRRNKLKKSDRQHSNSAVISLYISPHSPIVIKLMTRVTWLLGYSWSFCLDSFRELEIELTICT